MNGSRSSTRPCGTASSRPGISLNTQEKVEIANQLARLGVDVIEAGFPITSPGDFEAVEAIARTVTGRSSAGWPAPRRATSMPPGGRSRTAERPRIHTFISTSDIHIEHQLRTDREDVKGQAKAAVAHARELCEDVEFSPMDATRAERRVHRRGLRDRDRRGRRGDQHPRHRRIHDAGRVHGVPAAASTSCCPSWRDVRLSVHCHDDLGLAVANSFAGVLAGARQVECAINGIGERAGNCALEEIVMLLRTRRGDHGFDTGLETTELARTSRMVSRFTGYVVQPNKAIVGRNAFAHESGIHQDGVLKERTTFEIMDARDVGLDSNQIVLGKHSGRHALKDALRAARLRRRGQRPEPGVQALQGARGQEEAGHRAGSRGDRLRRDARDVARSTSSPGSRSRPGTGRDPVARVGVTTPAGEEVEGESGGDGPIDAVFGAIQTAVDTECELNQFLVSAVGEGDDALGEVTVMLRAHGRLASGQGVSTDIIEASAQAYVRALANALDGAAVREAESVVADAASAASPFPPGP